MSNWKINKAWGIIVALNNAKKFSAHTNKKLTHRNYEEAYKQCDSYKAGTISLDEFIAEDSLARKLSMLWNQVDSSHCDLTGVTSDEK